MWFVYNVISKHIFKKYIYIYILLTKRDMDLTFECGRGLYIYTGRANRIGPTILDFGCHVWIFKAQASTWPRKGIINEYSYLGHRPSKVGNNAAQLDPDSTYMPLPCPSLYRACYDSCGGKQHALPLLFPWYYLIIYLFMFWQSFLRLLFSLAL